ncbi:MAG: hypothetical protein Q7S87_03105 [Agitococcus sp.]|nr:hypothetical protein [Agitococcus sp.]MDO9177167.1 hypothetical protein [Agitococcus sp.]
MKTVSRSSTTSKKVVPSTFSNMGDVLAFGSGIARSRHDPFVVFSTGTPGNNSSYSDRLYQWDDEKYNRICRQIFGNEAQVWDARTPMQTEQFLREYFDKPELVLTKIMKGTNVSSGYPYWYFEYCY